MDNKYVNVKYDGQDMQLRGFFYDTYNEQKERKPMIGLELYSYSEDTGEYDEPYVTISVSFGVSSDYFGAFFLDTNNVFDAEEFIKSNRLGFSTPYSMSSGFCTYPLYILSYDIATQLYDEEELLDYQYSFLNDKLKDYTNFLLNEAKKNEITFTRADALRMASYNEEIANTIIFFNNINDPIAKDDAIALIEDKYGKPPYTNDFASFDNFLKITEMDISPQKESPDYDDL